MELTSLQEKNINLIKSVVESKVQIMSRIKDFEFSYPTDTDQYFEAILRFDSFYATISYELNGSNDGKITMFLCFDGCEYRFSIYEIFNLFDIDDFNIYEFDYCINSERINNALSKLFCGLDIYHNDISKANTNKCTNKLIKSRQRDMQIRFKGYAEKENLVDGEFNYVSFYHKIPRDRAIANLESLEAENKLTKYEQRLLKYLNQGFDVYDAKSSFGTSYKMARFYMYGINAILALAAMLILYPFVKESAFGSNAYVFNFDESPFTMVLNSFGIGGVALFVGLNTGIGKVFSYLICAPYERDVARAKLGLNRNTRDIGINLVKVVVPLLVCGVMLYSYTLNMSLTDTQFVADNSENIVIDFEDMEVYQPEHWTEHNNTSYADDYYKLFIKYGDDQYYVMPEASVDDNSTQHFVKTLKEKGVKINFVDTVNDIPFYDDIPQDILEYYD